MDDPEDEKFTLSFDLLFKGLEVTTGGQRIHDYQMLMDKIAARGMDAGGYGAVSGYLQAWNAASWRTGNRPGTSDHADCSDEENVRETCPVSHVI